MVVDKAQRLITLRHRVDDDPEAVDIRKLFAKPTALRSTSCATPNRRAGAPFTLRRNAPFGKPRQLPFDFTDRPACYAPPCSSPLADHAVRIRIELLERERPPAPGAFRTCRYGRPAAH